MNRNDAVETAKNDAEIFSLLAAFYNTNPDRRLTEAIDTVDTVAITDAEVRQTFIKMQTFTAQVEEQDITRMKCDWTKLFRGVSTDYGPKPPYEELYGGRKSPEILLELATMYTEAGYEFQGVTNRPDYVGAQLGYIAALFALSARHAMNGDEKAYRQTRSLAYSFIERFRGWFSKFRAEAEKHVETDFYRGVFELSSLMVA